MGTPKFALGVNVFAKMKGFPPWPAIIEAIHDLTPRKIKYSVFFYGTRQVAVIKERDLFAFSDHKETLGKRRKSASFNNSMDEAEARIFDENTEGSPLQLLATLQAEADGRASPGTSAMPENSASSSDMPENSASSSAMPENSASSSAMPENSASSTVEESLQMDTLDSSEDEEANEDKRSKIARSLAKERQLIGLIIDIQRSLGTTKANFNKCLLSLNEIEAMDISKLMLFKTPEIMITLDRTKRFEGSSKVKRLRHYKDKVNMIKTKAGCILDNIFATLFPPREGQAARNSYVEELEKFNTLTRNLSKEEILWLTEDDLIDHSSTQPEN